MTDVDKLCAEVLKREERWHSGQCGEDERQHIVYDLARHAPTLARELKAAREALQNIRPIIYAQSIHGAFEERYAFAETVKLIDSALAPEVNANG